MEYSIWTEKYRPQNFDEMVGQNEIRKRIKAFIESKNMPHLLFSGPAGVGKTTMSLIIAKQLFGNEWKQNMLELNASDERGIDVVRIKVKDFARTKAIGNVPFKIIYLDECDALTKEAQQALRRTMENYTQTCRFILSCNYSSKIIDPIQSRCAVFKFKPIPKEEIFKILEKIEKSENIKLSENGKEALFIVSQGDCRKAENLLQSCAVLHNEVDEKTVYEMSSYAKPEELKETLNYAISGDFLKAKNKLLDIMLKYGLSGIDIIKQIQQEIWTLDLDDNRKIELIDKCGEIEFRLVEGSDEFIQIEALLSQFIKKN
ncbi:MAG: replication factor C small subunit [Candidatus Woesearchaeota archaeon]